MYIEKIRDELKCVGCGNCCNGCPVDAISMRQDNCGFLAPFIDKQKCIDCGKCETVCPINGLIYTEKSDFPNTKIIAAKDVDFLKDVASGGLCSLLMDCFVTQLSGYICGAVYDKNFAVKHVLTNDKDLLKEMRHSKYVQSDLNSCVCEIEELLKKKQYVLFIGTACQVYAVKKYLKKEYERLFCVDLVCHGVPSPKVQQEYIKYLEKDGKKVAGLNNRNKKQYKHSYVSTYLVDYKDGSKIINRYSDDPMADAFFSHLSIRETCFDCSFKTIGRISDLTVGDFWFSEQYGMGEDKLGVNLCLIQSEKGNDLLNFVKNNLIEIDIQTERAVLLNGGMIYSSCKMNKNRTAFFSELGNIPFDDLVFKYDGMSKGTKFKNHLREIIAPALRKTRYYNMQLKKSHDARLKKSIPLDKKGKLHY